MGAPPALPGALAVLHFRECVGGYFTFSSIPFPVVPSGPFVVSTFDQSADALF
jgi:hypothetical protein